ncbi:phosphoserine phosphatase SerB [Arthrobacter sp. Br18]|uniref:phosphoserine phosphatase SerB n=1 Tax=Arthrobacter sp. Br18 TaxID=1312954 RepID=UPI00047AFF1D|nr:phosphoserine phosphatase SerB [Arthrobacter sp. Br18]
MDRDYRVVSYGTALTGSRLFRVRSAVTAVGGVITGIGDASGIGYTGQALSVTYGGTADGLRAAVTGALQHQPTDSDGTSAGTEGGARGHSRTTLSVPCDAGTAVVPAPVFGPGRKLLIMDVDSTLIKQEVIELLAAYAGKEIDVAEVTERAMRGELDFAESLHARVATLAGLPASVIDAAGRSIELSEGAEVLVDAFLNAGHHVAAVSGGFTQLLRPLARRLKLTYAGANLLEIVDGTLTGRVTGPVVDRAAKERALRQWAANAGIPLERTIAVGDGANDIDMVSASGFGVAFRAKPALREVASATVDMPFLDVVRHFAGL